MLQLDATWLDNISNRIWPIPLLVVKAAGNRVYSNRDVSDITASVFGPTEEPVISFENRVKSFGTIEKKIFDFTTTIVQGFGKKNLQASTIVLNNSDYEISALVNSERWHNKTFEIYLAYAGSTAKLKIFEGVIQDIFHSLSAGTITLKATESGYDQVFTPTTISDLTSSTDGNGPINPAAFTPTVYGDLNSTLIPLSVPGVWKLPHIELNITDGEVYCYAGHGVMPTLGGNLVRIWADDIETTSFVLNSNDTRFDVKPVATIALAGRSCVQNVTARGAGISLGNYATDIGGSSNVIENLVDIIEDFIQRKNSSVFEIDPTNRIDSKTFLDSTVFTPAPPSRFSGVITREVSVWTQIQEMLSGLGGTAFLSSDNGELKFVIDEFIKIPDNSLIISRGDILSTQAISRVKNIYNSINNRQFWSPAQNEFFRTGTTITNSVSINTYGIRELTLDTKWSFLGDDVVFLKSEFQNTVDRPLDIITCIIANPVIVQIEPGLDYLYLTFENLIGTDGEVRINEFCKVLSIKFLLDKNKAELTVMDTNRWKVTGTGQWIGDSSPRDMTLY